MRIFGFEITLRKAAPQGLTGVVSSFWRNPFDVVREPFAGAWQRNIEVEKQPSLLASSVVYACVSGIASDVAKNRLKFVQNNDGIWEEITSGPPWLSVLRKPNHFQTRIEFVEQWIISKLLAGNSYVLKERDQRRVVQRLYVLDPLRVRPMVAEDGEVFYQLNRDPLAQVSEVSGNFDTDNPLVPASEIIHDRMYCLWHPLVGVPPIYACGMSATMGNRIQANATNFFGNASRPGGILTAPGKISNDAADRLKAQFEANYSGGNVGRIAVLGDGLTFEPLLMTAENAQQVEQLEWSVQDVGRAFHYPVWKLGGPLPPYSSGPQALTLMYYTDCLQPLIEKLELCLDEGLELPLDKNYGTEVDIDNLLRMDTVALYESNNKAGNWMMIDEQRRRANLPPLPVGGNTVYRQEQDHSVEALAKRDAKPDPFAKSSTTPPATTPAPTQPEKDFDDQALESMTESEALLLIKAYG